MNIRHENGKALEDAGGRCSLPYRHDSITDSRLFLRMAAFGVRAGMFAREGA